MIFKAYYIVCTCMCACVCARVHACACLCVRVCGGGSHAAVHVWRSEGQFGHVGSRNQIRASDLVGDLLNGLMGP